MGIRDPRVATSTAQPAGLLRAVDGFPFAVRWSRDTFLGWALGFVMMLLAPRATTLAIASMNEVRQW